MFKDFRENFAKFRKIKIILSKFRVSRNFENAATLGSPLIKYKMKITK